MATSPLYTIAHQLNAPKRIVMLPVDEFVVLVVILLVAWLLDYLFWGFGAGGCCVLLLRLLKRGKGTGWLVRLVYWHLPHGVTGLVFRTFPDSGQRLFLT